MYKRKSNKFIIEQHVYVGKTEKEPYEMILGEGQALKFFSREELGSVPIGYDFDKLLDEFFRSVAGQA